MGGEASVLYLLKDEKNVCVNGLTVSVMTIYASLVSVIRNT